MRTGIRYNDNSCGAVASAAAESRRALPKVHELYPDGQFDRLLNLPAPGRRGWRLDMDLTRRAVMETPVLALAAAAPSTPQAATQVPGKFSTLDLGSLFNASAKDFGSHSQWRRLAGSQDDGLVRTPSGRQVFQGIPFLLGSDGVATKNLVLLGGRGSRSMEVPAGGTKAAFLCLAAFCNWDENETPPPGTDVAEKVGQVLGRAVFVYEDGTEKALPIRRRFEVNSPSIWWGRLSFTALTHLKHEPARLTDPLDSAVMWGELQTAVWDNGYPRGNPALIWISALANPEPDRAIRALRFESAADDPLAICGATFYHGREHPLRRDRLKLYRVTLPEPAGDPLRWKAEVDLGIIARSFVLPEFRPAEWLASVTAGRGERRRRVLAGRELYLEITANPEATLTLSDGSGNRRFAFDLSRVNETGIPAEQGQEARIEVLERRAAWLRGQVLDAATGRPVPVRIAFRSREGRYIPPYGHRREVNRWWFQDYGADLAIGDDAFAYIDGSFQAELPVGEVYVELSRGFEYEAVRRRIEIQPGQRELRLEIKRMADLRSRGWITADSHVHFLSPSTAVLEAHAEGLNAINLLAAQWRDLFTNVGDLFQDTLRSPDGEAMVWVGTENRQHLLGHLALLGGHGAPVFPMSAAGPGESYLGDPVHHSLADWADACHGRDALAIAVHFPYPNAELAAGIALGKIDALEIYPYGEHTNSVRFLDWYRYLNCGYRLPVVGGTDKMSAGMPAGANRTYAYIGQDELSFASWAKAVRTGRTFMTTGPLITLEADGRMPGGEIPMPNGGGTVEVRASAVCAVPIHRLQIVLNGRVVASRENAAGTRELTLSESIKVAGPGWIAARCASKLGPQTAWPFGIQAHTSPIYLLVPGRELFSPDAAAYMLTLIDASEAWLRTLATRPDDPEQFTRVLKVCADAREKLHQRLHKHGVNH
jgi:hypothetical protein